jgi:hypothetical protein
LKKDGFKLQNVSVRPQETNDYFHRVVLVTRQSLDSKRKKNGGDFDESRFTVSRTSETGVLWCRFEIKEGLPNYINMRKTRVQFLAWAITKKLDDIFEELAERRMSYPEKLTS